jgi:K(+)-stimulated pyrophosphate-energized sodium pump
LDHRIHTRHQLPPGRSIAKASETGHGTNVIQGLAISLESTAMPTIVICVGIIVSYQLAGLIGIAFAATAMLALAGMVVALDATAPVTDNAGGIAEMAGIEDEVRHRTDALDAVGNTTKAVTKGYAIGSAGSARVVLFGATRPICRSLRPTRHAGGSISRSAIRTSSSAAARRAAALSVRGDGHDRGRPRGGRRRHRRARTVSHNPGIMDGTSRPNYARTVDLVTRAAIKEMIVPSLLPVLAPIAVYFIIAAIAGRDRASRRSARCCWA